jgi:nucleoside-diphosphate-sugar epimerase
VKLLNNKKLIIGSSGFLGRTIVKALNESTTQPNSVFRSVRTNNQIFIALHSKTTNEPISLEEFFFETDKEIQIINCASSRYSRSNDESKRANYLVPKTILNIATASCPQEITWIQPESFWQYTLDSTPDIKYVYWKNRFGIELDEVLKTSKHFECIRVVLPHLFGVNDTQTRFIPKLFRKLLCENLVNVNGSEDNFVIADILDVANYCLQILKNNSVISNERIVLFPYHEISLKGLVNKFLDVHGISPQIVWNEFSSSLNPSMKLRPDFFGVPANLVLTTLETSLSKIGSWLIQDINKTSGTLA